MEWVAHPGALTNSRPPLGEPRPEGSYRKLGLLLILPLPASVSPICLVADTLCSGQRGGRGRERLVLFEVGQADVMAG